jgi:hypothetical protein
MESSPISASNPPQQHFSFFLHTTNLNSHYFPNPAYFYHL